jgi:hypothetical protein
VLASLGRGGMAQVYRVLDEVRGQELALKQLRPPADSKRQAVTALFEAEFHMLAQLSHPRVIEVYDYGLTENGPFYTMELLDGGDLSERAPLPWRQACLLIYDVCSSLALLHSRRFVHRDVTPRNVRCTRDGRAKLIDFGTMTAMGQTRVMAGTPAFCAPEVVHRSAIDGRADLFSLGATLYYALTRRSPYAARDFTGVLDAWKRRPVPPSSLVLEIPAALDALVLGLISLDPALRPRTAFEVMERLSAIAGIERDEELVSQAYLSTPTLVARQDALSALTSALEHAELGRGSAHLVRAESGTGRSRILDACALEAKARGAIVLRAAGSGAAGDAQRVSRALAEQLSEATGEPWPAATAPGDLPDALLPALLAASKQRLVMIAVDDMQRCDVDSASLLATLAAEAERERLCLVLTLETGATQAAPDAVEVLSGYCRELPLPALSRDQTEDLLSSLFGAVPNLGMLTEAIHELAQGSPRKCLDLVQHLIDRGALRYAAGGWTLPERIDRAELPSSAEDAMQARLSLLDPLARSLAEAHALCLYDTLSHEDYAALRPDADGRSLDRALLQLVAQQVLVRDGTQYAFARRSFTALLTAGLDEPRSKALHLSLARLYEQRTPIAAVHHLLLGGERELAVTRLYAFVQATAQEAITLWELSGRMRPADLLDVFERAHRAAVDLRRPARECVVLRGWIAGLSLMGDDAYYYRFAPEWLAQLEHDSGLSLYRELESELPDPGARLMRALQLTAERFATAPEAERVYPPDEAIRLLVIYVGVSIAVGSRSLDMPLLSSLPGLLEPFVPLSPLIDAIRKNAIASRFVGADSRFEQARALWLEVYAQISQVDPAELPAIVAFRGAVAYALGLCEARIGLESAKDWVELLDREPAHRVNALYLRKTICLHHGDFEGAERWRKQAELAALKAPMRQMFTNMVTAELWAHTAAADLVGVKHALERIAQLAARYPAWRTFHELAIAEFERLRGDIPSALAAFERCLPHCAPDPREPERVIAAWPSAVAGYVDALLCAGRNEQARDVAHAALEQCGQLQIGSSAYEIARGLSLAEAKLGAFEHAFSRLEQVIAGQIAMGVKGVQLGLSYEACTRIAIWAGDEERLPRYAALTATEHRYGRGSPLGVRYERLMEEARSAGRTALPELAELVPSTVTVVRAKSHDAVSASVVETMVGARDHRQRAERALHLLCDARRASAGHLYLCTASGIACAASEGAPEPPPELRAFLERYLRLDEDACDSKTVVETDLEAGRTNLSTSFCDDRGAVHRPLLLNGLSEGAACPIGIVSFIDGPQPQPVDPALCSAIAAYLLDAGDVRPS